MANPLNWFFRKCLAGEISLSDYRAFLQSIDKFRFLNDTYINIARLKKPSFFVLHHDVHRDIDRMVDFAKVEHELGWKANYFLRNDPEVMKYPPARKMINLKHDVGLLYDMLDTCHTELGMTGRELEQRAWLRFQNALMTHLDFNITAIACYNRSGGLDNRSLWKNYKCQTMNIRCDADTDFCEDDIVYFHVNQKEVLYQRRDYYGEYHRLKPWIKIRGIRDLGRRLRLGKLNRRIVVRFKWN
jgi:hypothetical protein